MATCVATSMLVGAVKGALIGAVSGAITGAIMGAITERIRTGTWEGAIQGTIDGASDVFMCGGIFAGAGQMLSGAMKITRTAPNFNGVQIGKVKLWSPNAAGNPNTGGTLIKFGRFNRID